MEQFINDLLRSPSHTVGSEQNHKKPLTKSKTVTIPHGGLRTLAKIFIQRNGKWILLTLSPSHAVGLEPTMQMTITCTMFFRHYPTQWAWNELGKAWRHEHYICVVSIPHGGLRTSGLLVRLSFGLMRLHPTQWAQNLKQQH